MEESKYARLKWKLLTAIIQFSAAISNFFRALKGKPRSFFDL
jgi:hypothetical protein